MSVSDANRSARCQRAFARLTESQGMLRMAALNWHSLSANRYRADVSEP